MNGPHFHRDSDYVPANHDSAAMVLCQLCQDGHAMDSATAATWDRLQVDGVGRTSSIGRRLTDSTPFLSPYTQSPFMRDFNAYLLGMSLLLGSILGCRQQKAPPEGELPGETSSGGAASPDAATAESARLRSETPPRDRIPSAEERKACLGPPLSPGAEQLPEIEGLRHVARDREHVFLPERPGQDHLRTDGLDAVAQRIKERLGTETTYGLGLCGRDRSHRTFRCLRLVVAICVPWVNEVRRLASVVRGEGLGIAVEIEGRVEPRCSLGDPNCGPLPYHEPITDSYQETRNWAGDFTLPLRSTAEHQTLRNDLSAGSCTHAGDCVRAGCGNNCDAWYQPVYATGCPGFRDLSDAYCGCVEGQCAWFTQPETARLRGQAKVQGWQGDIPQQEPPQPRTADELFERRLTDEWMLRQMRRLAPSRTLPKQIEFSFTWHPKTRVTALTLLADGQPAPAWLVTLFEHLRMPQPEVRPFRSVRVEGTLRVEDAPNVQGAPRVKDANR